MSEPLAHDRGSMGMEMPFTIDVKLTVANIDAEAGVIVLRDEAGNLHIMEFAGTIVNRPLTDAEKAYALQLVDAA